MKINEFRVLFPHGETMHEVWGLEYEGKLWLVPDWLLHKEKKLRRPARLIRFDNKPHSAGPGGRWLVTAPIPKSVLDGKSTDGYETLSGDEIEFAFPYEFPTLH